MNGQTRHAHEDRPRIALGLVALGRTCSCATSSTIRDRALDVVHLSWWFHSRCRYRQCWRGRSRVILRFCLVLFLFFVIFLFPLFLLGRWRRCVALCLRRRRRWFCIFQRWGRRSRRFGRWNWRRSLRRWNTCIWEGRRCRVGCRSVCCGTATVCIVESYQVRL